MFRRCVMSHGRRLTTASSREHQTNFKTYRSHIPPLTPFNQLLVFRSLSTATPPNHEDAKGSKPDSGSFYERMKNIYDEFIRMKKEYEDMKYVNRDERTREGYLKYHISGFRGAYDKSMTVEIRNNRQLVVSGRTYKSDGSSVVIERHITIPNNGYSEAKKRATFYPNVGSLVVEISHFNKAQDIKIDFEDTKA
ncbi:hypothetical protein Tco_0605624 [Tanacetum coccineum]